MRTGAVVFLLSLAGLSVAQQIPNAYPDDGRVKHVAFQAHNVVRLKATTFTTSQLLFSKQEAILAVEGGDTTAWMVTYHDNLPYMLFIKPTQLHSKTNMTVVTTKHTYYFELRSNASMNSKTYPPLYALQFDYPEEEKTLTKVEKKSALAKQQSLKSKKEVRTLNGNYRFSGSAQLVPAQVYDDGRFTYFELTDNQPVPAIFAVNGQEGKESVVNLRQKGNTLIVQRLAPQFTLRHGGMVASVFNTNEINRIQQARR